MPLPRLLGCLLPATAAIFLLLEIWRPYFFLTDDNLAQYFPVLTEIGRHLKDGQSPFVSDYLFGGHYNLLRDNTFPMWHPVYLLSSLVADTPAWCGMIDIIAFVLVLFTATGFALLAYSLREELRLELPDGYLIFLSLSFTYSTFLLTIGSSWVVYLVSYSALPWLAFGLLRKNWLFSVSLITLLTIHQILGANMDRTILNILFLSVFAAGVAIHRRSLLPVLVWEGGLLLGALLASPVLLPNIDGFAHAPRASGWTAEALTVYSVPALTCPFSLFFGNYSEPIASLTHDSAALTWPFTSTLPACAASWCLIPALFNRLRWNALDRVCLGIAGLLLLIIIRPLWVGEIISRLPVLHSIRWPFREILQFEFFLHLFLVLRSQGSSRLRSIVAVCSLTAFLLPLPFVRIPTLNPLKVDRDMLFSGKLERFWDQAKSHLGPDDEIVTVIATGRWNNPPGKMSYGLMGTASFPALLRIKSISGYSGTSPADQVPLKIPPRYWTGAFDQSQIQDVLREQPRLKVIFVEGISPLKITLLGAAPYPIDLTTDFH